MADPSRSVGACHADKIISAISCHFTGLVDPTAETRRPTATVRRRLGAVADGHSVPIRRRGGAEALLFTVSDDPALVGNTLEQVAKLRQKSVVETVIELVQGNKIRVASFNMSTTDIENFMIKSWVVTSSDGTDGHPRKYASFPKKYRQYVVEQKLLSLAQFITQSSAKTAQILKLKKRGLLVVGNYADIVMFDPDKFSDQATFSQWNRLSQGVEYVMVNGQITIDGGQYNNVLNGKVVR